MMDKRSDRWLMERRKQIAMGKIKVWKHCVNWDPETCPPSSLCSCPSFELLPSVGDKVKCRRCGLIDVITQGVIGAMKEERGIWDGRFFCINCGSDETELIQGHAQGHAPGQGGPAAERLRRVPAAGRWRIQKTGVGRNGNNGQAVARARN